MEFASAIRSIIGSSRGPCRPRWIWTFVIGESRLYPMVQGPIAVSEIRVRADSVANELPGRADGRPAANTLREQRRHRRSVGASRTMRVGSIDPKAGKPQALHAIHVEVNGISLEVAAFDDH